MQNRGRKDGGGRALLGIHNKAPSASERPPPRPLSSPPFPPFRPRERDKTELDLVVPSADKVESSTTTKEMKEVATHTHTRRAARARERELC